VPQKVVLSSSGVPYKSFAQRQKERNMTNTDQLPERKVGQYWQWQISFNSECNVYKIIEINQQGSTVLQITKSNAKDKFILLDPFEYNYWEDDANKWTLLDSYEAPTPPEPDVIEI